MKNMYRIWNIILTDQSKVISTPLCFYSTLWKTTYRRAIECLIHLTDCCQKWFLQFDLSLRSICPVGLLFCLNQENHWLKFQYSKPTARLQHRLQAGRRLQRPRWCSCTQGSGRQSWPWWEIPPWPTWQRKSSRSHAGKINFLNCLESSDFNQRFRLSWIWQ